MALNCKFIVFFVLINVYLTKSQNRSSRQSLYDFKHMNPKELYPKSFPLFYSSSPPPVNVYTPIYKTEPQLKEKEKPIRLISSDISFRFSNVGLKRIGQDFIISNDIITLSLDKNEISEVSPFAFRKMKNLRHLNLSGNKIPKEKFLLLYGNINLQTLIINNNNDISRGTFKEYEILQSLEHLHLCNDNISNIEVPFHLATPSLINLHLSNNSITSENIIFDNLPATLTHLHLDRNLIGEVKQNKLRNLYELMLDHNSIVEVCYELCNYPSLSLKGALEMRNLHLSNNSISLIMTDAFNDMRHLSHLDLSNNQINEIFTGTFNNTNMITKLFLANNSLSIVPDICSMSHLKQLDLSGNRISGIFSNTFCPLNHLESLDLSNNQITSIQTRAFMQLSRLKYLDLSRNQLRQLPARWISPWNVEELHLEQNNFANLEDLSLTDLKSNQLDVYLEGNPMVIFKAAHFNSLPGHLTVHIKNMKVEGKCTCNCEDDEEDDDDDIDNGDNDNNSDNGGFGYFG